MEKEASEEVAEEDTPSMDRRVAVREEMGIAGLSQQQRHQLMVVEKRMKRKEYIAKSAKQWALDRVDNKQQHYRVSQAAEWMLAHAS